MSSDPLRLLWDALEAGGYQPRGKPYEFRARCPGHEGNNGTSLSAGVGADGRALVWCHAHGCGPEAITGALGLSVADLFPDGHRHGRHYPLPSMRRSHFDGAARRVVNALYALETLEEEWVVIVGCRCPACGDPGGWLRATPERVEVDCGADCDARAFTNALLGRLDEREAAA